MEKDSPCKGCLDRSTGQDRAPCHSTCERYAAYKAAHAKEVEAHDKYWKVHGIIQEGKRRRWETPQSTVRGTFKERRAKSGQFGPCGRV